MEFLRILRRREEVNLAVMEYSYPAWILLKSTKGASINKQLLDCVEFASLSHCLSGEILGEGEFVSIVFNVTYFGAAERKFPILEFQKAYESWFGFAGPSEPFPA